MPGPEDRLFEDDPDIRFGGQPAETRIGGFAVYGGAPADREALQNDDPELIDLLSRELGDILDGYGDAVHGERPGDRTVGFPLSEEFDTGDEND